MYVVSLKSIMNKPGTESQHLAEIAIVSLKLGCIGFGGIAGMVSIMEDELVIKRQWINRAHYMDAVGTANLVPGPNAVEIMMHCAREKGGRRGLIIGGISYILPSMLICLLLGMLYVKYGQLPAIQPFLRGIAPATTAIIVNAVIRLSKSMVKTSEIAFLSVIVLAGSLYGLNDVLLLFGAGIAGTIYKNRHRLFTFLPLSFLFIDNVSYRMFLAFLKIGAILYGSGYVLFAYLDETLVKHNHWLTARQLTDAISVGQMTPGPILSTATFAGYLVNGTVGAIIATVAIFLPSFFIAFFMNRLLAFINRHLMLRNFLDIVNGASVALIAAIAIQMIGGFFREWQPLFIFLVSLSFVLYTKINSAWLILAGGIIGCLLHLAANG